MRALPLLSSGTSLADMFALCYFIDFHNDEENVYVIFSVV